jgi:hypothetical protein
MEGKGIGSLPKFQVWKAVQKTLFKSVRILFFVENALTLRTLHRIAQDLIALSITNGI